MNERTAIAFQHREQTFSRAPVERDNIIPGSCRAIEMAESKVRAVPCNQDILLERSAFFSGDQLCIFFSLVTRMGCLRACPSAKRLRRFVFDDHGAVRYVSELLGLAFF